MEDEAAGDAADAVVGLGCGLAECPPRLEAGSPGSGGENEGAAREGGSFFFGPRRSEGATYYQPQPMKALTPESAYTLLPMSG
jgi:hypothetical protein